MSAPSLPAKLFWLAVLALGLVSTAARPQTNSNSDKLAESRDASAHSIQMKLFADRLTVGKDEAVKVNVWVESKSADDCTLQIFFSEPQFTLQGDNPRVVSFSPTSPTNLPVTFILKALRPGKSNILVRASGTDKETKKTLSATQQLQGIEVQEGTLSLKTLTSNPLAGVMVGALLTFLTTSLNDRRLRRKERTEKRQWLTGTLPFQLQRASEAVTNEQKTEFDPLTSKLSTENYFAELGKLSKNNSDLIRTLSRLSRDLHDYEEARINSRLDHTFRDNLATELNQTAQKLRELG